MVKEIFKCNKCCIYTLLKICPICKKETSSPKPPKFSLEDRFGEYRRKFKNEEK